MVGRRPPLKLVVSNPSPQPPRDWTHIALRLAEAVAELAAPDDDTTPDDRVRFALDVLQGVRRSEVPEALRSAWGELREPKLTRARRVELIIWLAVGVTSMQCVQACKRSGGR